MEKKTYKIGFAITGSFCTFDKIKDVIEKLVKEGHEVFPIFSENAASIDSRFTKATDFLQKIEEITGKKGVYTIEDAEPIGPRGHLDVMVIAPCTGNTMAKFANGITDSPVLMAAKAHIRNEKPVVISISTNDALGMNFKNIGALMNLKHVYFVPFGQDNFEKKPTSMIAHVEMIEKTIEAAMRGSQVQPVVVSPMDFTPVK